MSSKVETYLKEADNLLGQRFRGILESLSPQIWSSNKIDDWQKRLCSYIEVEDHNLNLGEWEELEANLQNFHKIVLKQYKEGSEDSIANLSPNVYAKKAVDAIKVLKATRWKINAAVEEIFYDDAEAEVLKVVDKLIDDVVILVEGGRAFERVNIDWSSSEDENFSQELFNFCSAGRILPEAEEVPWVLRVNGLATKSLPRDIVKRLIKPTKIGEIDDHEDWEFSATHEPMAEEVFARFKSSYECYRKNLKEILTEEIQKYSSNLISAETIDSAVVQDAADKIKNNEVDVDFKSLFILPYETNQCKLIPIRDESLGNIISYKEILKPGSERIVDKHLRSDPNIWTDPVRHAGPKVRCFGWEPLANLEDLLLEQSKAHQKRETIEAFSSDILTESILEPIKKKIDMQKAVLRKQHSTKDACTSGNPTLKEYLEKRGQCFGLVPDQFQSPQDFLEALCLPEFLKKDVDGSFPLKGDMVTLDENWLGFDGIGGHEQLTEQQYWKQLRSFKKPASAPLVDWTAILNQETLNDLEGSDDGELKQCLDEVSSSDAKLQDQSQATESVDDCDLQLGEKDTPARKRVLDQEFVQDWVLAFRSEEGIQGYTQKTFKPPEHLVSLEEYEELFLTHPHTSSYVFHPNFVRFRRMTRNHPTYSEYSFEKLGSSSPLDNKSNLIEFERVLNELERNGPELLIGSRQVDEKNMGIDSVSVKIWNLEFNSCMSKGLSRLDGYASSSCKGFEKPDVCPKEEQSDDLLFADVDDYEVRDVHKYFYLQPFTLEDFNSLPFETKEVGKICDEERSKSPAEAYSDSESGDEAVLTNFAWRPCGSFSGYNNANILQLLSNASQLIKASFPKDVYPPPKVLKWLHGEYQPSRRRLRAWRKKYHSLFPDVSGPMRTPYLFLPEDKKLAYLQKPTNVEDADDPWRMTDKEKADLKNKALPKDENQEEVPDADASGKEAIVKLEERLGMDGKPAKKTEWAEELDTREAPDMSVLGTPAMIFPFELDNFQKQAIMALENGFNVFVSAHTSAGKTAVAEYAIAMSRKRRSRCIYTSPIKALSNQKYKDFKRNFDTVGLITGDVQLNESSDCLIMTTEILRSMLYNSSEGIRDLEFVVLDEVHYMNDRERGHVWEEVLILLPANVQIVMLSATVPNTMEFASWVGRNKQRKVMVCRTQHRPVPLMHYFYVDVSKLKNSHPSAGRFLLKEGDKPLNKNEWPEIKALMDQVGNVARDDRRNFLRSCNDGVQKCKLHEQQQPQNLMKTHGTGPNSNELMKFYAKKERQHWIKFIKHLKEIDWLPTIVFAFSRKKCDELAELVDLDLTTEEEKLRIVAFIKSQVSLLLPEDQNLPQIKTVKKHLKRGIGVHHSGILPVLKEIVEVLFQEGIVRLLFATETFAMGVNMPARTVVFNSIDKHDGVDRRYLLPAEYIQMAGRAGRRDKDTFGNVIIRCPTKDRDRRELTIDCIESMMTGSPCTLTSQFRVSYRMILTTLTARSQISAVNMMARSYHENKAQQKLYQHKDDLRLHEESETKQRILVHSRLKKEDVDIFIQLYLDLKKLSKMRQELKKSQLVTNKFIRETVVGKFIKFCCGPVIEQVGVIAKVTVNPPEYTVIALKNSGNILLDDPPEENWAQLWYDLLYVLPTNILSKSPLMDQDMNLIVYKIKPTDIIEVYKDSFPMSEENFKTLLRDINLSNIGGKSGVTLHSGLPLQIGSVFPIEVTRTQYNTNQTVRRAPELSAQPTNSKNNAPPISNIGYPQHYSMSECQPNHNSFANVQLHHMYPTKNIPHSSSRFLGQPLFNLDHRSIQTHPRVSNSNYCLETRPIIASTSQGGNSHFNVSWGVPANFFRPLPHNIFLNPNPYFRNRYDPPYHLNVLPQNLHPPMFNFCSFQPPINSSLHPHHERCAQMMPKHAPTKSDKSLDTLCYRLHAAKTFKAIDEILFAREGDFELYKMMKIKEESTHALANNLIGSWGWQDFIRKFGLVFKWMELVSKRKLLAQMVSEETMSLYPEYTNKMDVLKTMKYVVDDSVQMKGYMAARISKFELVVTEMLTRNVIKDLTPEEVAGLMSFIVYQPKGCKRIQDDEDDDDDIDKADIPYRSNLTEAITITKQIIQEIRDIETSNSTHSEGLDNLENAFELVNVMYSWAKQMSFCKVIGMAKDYQEGMLVRWIQRLVEALKDIESAARVMGDPAVPEKIQSTIKVIRRGIVFAPSLYTTL